MRGSNGGLGIYIEQGLLLTRTGRGSCRGLRGGWPEEGVVEPCAFMALYNLSYREARPVLG